MFPNATKMERIQSLAVLFILIWAILGRAQGSDLLTEISGKWKAEQGSDVVDIQLSKEIATLTIGGHTFKGVVESSDRGTNTVNVKVKTEDGSSEVWSIHEVWDDNGSTFNLNLRRNGTTETLVPVGHS